jgi:mono/diheme cytochrome c family protein
MKNYLYIILFFLVTNLLFTSCYKDNEEDLYPNKKNCEKTDVTFKDDIAPLVMDNCLSCHGNTSYTSIGGGIALEGYDNLIVMVNNGLFLSSITHDGNASLMPKNSNKLSECNITLITTWIENGAENN